MYFPNKTIHPANVAFAGRMKSGRFSIGRQSFRLSARGTNDDIHHICIVNRRLWGPTPGGSEITLPTGARPARSGPRSRLIIKADGSILLSDSRGRCLLHARAGTSFGVCGSAWLFQFEQHADMQFFGMGEKSTPFEKSGRVHRFWNTDAFADFYPRQVVEDHYDPDYISIPYVVIKRGNEYIGLLIDNPYAAVIGIPAPAGSARPSIDTGPHMYFGSENGEPSLYLLYGPTLAELTRKLASLVGTAPLPPLWALGHHQCRWGYRSARDLLALADNFKTHRIPNDGLWLDIDYMRGFRVFTFDKKNFPAPHADIRAIRDRGFHVVPIIDPGIKFEPGYPAYESGKKAGVFCKNAAGRDFIGLVWPGRTVFPDFSTRKGRRWWARQFAAFARTGISGAWLDMNDPATGAIDCTGMLFDSGRLPHEAFHNRFAMLMARASLEGWRMARPDERPLLISRSGSTGSHKYCGHWQGDSSSNYFHLHVAIAKTINLGLSGVSFTGTDVGGFGGDTNERLIVDWYKACFLFPFFRNHTAADTRRQEPWAFSRTALERIRHYIRLRYTLLPYLYTLFAAHEERGEPVLRPLFYDFEERGTLPLTVDDQFMVGPAIMQAPFTHENQSTRGVVLPDARWFDCSAGDWTYGNRRITVRNSGRNTPLYIRDGSLVPMQRGTPTTNAGELRSIDLGVFLSLDHQGTAECSYSCDDGASFDYRKGRRSTIRILARREARRIHIDIESLADGYGPVAVEPITPGRLDEVTITEKGVRRALKPAAFVREITGAAIRFQRWR